MTELKHAEVICHMAKHGFESVEGRPTDKDVFVLACNYCNPSTDTHWEWRIKPATITYTVTVPEPMRVMPKDGEMYWTIFCHGADKAKWISVASDKERFATGNIWDTEAKAQAAFDALFGPLRAVK